MSYLKKAFVYAALAVNAVTLSSGAIRTYDIFNDKANGLDFTAVNATATVLASPLVQGSDWQAEALGKPMSETFHYTPNSLLADGAGQLLQNTGCSPRETAMIAAVPGTIETIVGAPGAWTGGVLGSIVYAVKTAMAP